MSTKTRLTARAQMVVKGVEAQARLFDHEYMSTEHILLSLVQHHLGTAAGILRKANIARRRVIQEVEKIIQSGTYVVLSNRLAYTPPAKTAMEYAMAEARALGHCRVGTGHILLGLLRQEEGVAYQVLTKLGLSAEGVRAEMNTLTDSEIDTADVPVDSDESKLSEQVLIGFCAGICAVSGLPVHSISTVYQLMQQPENNQRFTDLVASIRSQLGTIN